MKFSNILNFFEKRVILEVSVAKDEEKKKSKNHYT